MRISLHELAIDDLREIEAWLSEDSASAPAKFFDEFRTAAAFIATHPQAGHPCGKFRRWNLKRFPFHLLYLVPGDDDQLWIMVVRHNRRHPSHGMKRRPPL